MLRRVSILASLALTLLMTPAAWAQFRGFQIPPAVRNIFLLRTDVVQKELDLSGDQIAAITDLSNKMQSEMLEVLSGLQDLSDEEKKEALPELMKTVGEKAKDLQEKVDKTLNPKQQARMKELSLQQRGVEALNDDEVIGALNLSDDQKTKLSAIREEAAAKQEEMMNSLFSGGGGDAGALRTKLAAFRKELGEKALAVLTDAQREQFEKMKGAKFNFPQGGRGFGL